MTALAVVTSNGAVKKSWPLLAIQGRDDGYGTLARIDAISAAVPHTCRLVLDACGHSPQRDQPQALTDAVLGRLRV